MYYLHLKSFWTQVKNYWVIKISIYFMFLQYYMTGRKPRFNHLKQKKKKVYTVIITLD